jgi:hypothetical protein
MDDAEAWFEEFEQRPIYKKIEKKLDELGADDLLRARVHGECYGADRWSEEPQLERLKSHQSFLDSVGIQKKALDVLINAANEFPDDVSWALHDARLKHWRPKEISLTAEGSPPFHETFAAILTGYKEALVMCLSDKDNWRARNYMCLHFPEPRLLSRWKNTVKLETALTLKLTTLFRHDDLWRQGIERPLFLGTHMREFKELGGRPHYKTA